jgi:superfamily I DNA/RNA helicase
VNLFDAVDKALSFKFESENDKYELEGWTQQGTTPAQCEECDSQLESFRCPYTTSRGEYRYWALVCSSCQSVKSLDEFDEATKKILRKWDSGKTTKTGETKRPLSGEARGPMRPTSEQSAIVAAVARDIDIAINALAGTGKTTTLKLIADQVAPRRGYYVAFNKAIVNDARTKFPESITCVTAHSLAYRAIGHRFKGRLPSPRVSWGHLAEHFDVEPFRFSANGDSFEFEPPQVARFADRTVQRFCKSIDQEITSQHVPLIPLVRVSEKTTKDFQQLVLEVARMMWSDLLKRQGHMKFVHDHYLKMWQLTKPAIPGDILLFDEAQDADPVMLDVVNSQENSQLVYCGDSYQSIYEWRGAKDALTLVHVDEKLWLTQSFRFGPEIAEVANGFLRMLQSPELVRGLTGLTSTIGMLTNPDAVLCRTNFGAIVSLQEAQARGQKAALLGDVKEGLQEFARGCLRLIQGHKTGHPELALFKDWESALKWADDEEESSSETAMLIRLVEGVGAGKLLRVLDDVVEEELADVTISTAHKAKGREWNRVRLAGDFKHPADMTEDELKTTYVAVTRAKQKLDISEIPSEPGEAPRLFNKYSKKDYQSTKRKSRKRPPIGSSDTTQKSVNHGALGRLLRNESDN